MILKLRLGKWRLTITLAPVINVIGVNSLLPDGNHILMWDYDDTTFDKVLESLIPVQHLYGLPNIYILTTGKPLSYIAYCFKKVDWRTAVEIIAASKYVCLNFFKWGVFRKRFTLRVGPKCGRIPKLYYVFESKVPETADIPQLRSWVMYETLSDGYKPRIIKLGEAG